MAKRILVFDDKPENLRVAKQAYDKLAKYGFSVETTSNPDEALDKIERGEADILVTDLYAPREMISPRILDKWKGLTNQAAKYFKGEEGSYEIQDSDGEPIDLKKRTKGRKASDKRYALGRPASYKFHHPKWGADVRVPYDEVASINRVMSMEPTRTERRNAKSPGMRDWKFWENNLLPPTIKPSNEDFTLEEFKRLNHDVDEESLELIHKNYQKGRSVYIEKMKEAQKDVPVGVVLYAAAQEKGIPANIVSYTHRHALQGHTRDIRGGGFAPPS